MSAVGSVFARAGRGRGLRLTATALPLQASQRRLTSWIAWEQPNPDLYKSPSHASLSSETQKGAIKSHDTRSVGEAATAPVTAAVGKASQEVSTSGRTTPSSVQACTGPVPHPQARPIQIRVESASPPPTTLLCIPGVPSTWPDETPTHPDQKRVRRLGAAHANEGPRWEGSPRSQGQTV